MVIVSVSVEPLAAVTVTVIGPAALTVVVAVVAPLLQAYVPPPVAVKLILVVVQVNSVVEGGKISATGGKVQSSVNKVVVAVFTIGQPGIANRY